MTRNRFMKKGLRTPGKPDGNISLKIALVYALLGGLWILISDSLLSAMVSSQAVFTRLAIYKGWFYVVSTAIMLYLLINRGVSRISQTVEALRESENRLAGILETMADGITIADGDGVITFANAAAENMLGLTRNDIEGRAYNDPKWRITTVDGEPFPSEELPVARVMRTGEPVHLVDFAIEHPDGTRVILAVSSAPILNGDRIAGVVSSIRDITERIRSQEELRLRREQEFKIREEAEEAKRQFYRGTIYSMTDGKLNLVPYDEIRATVMPSARVLPVKSEEDLANLRVVVRGVAEGVGMAEDRVYELVIAVGEAAANAIKHAHGGEALVGVKEDVVQVCIHDAGPGIDTLVFPKATLMKRFSTTTSMGLGYALILASVDIVYLSTEKGRTCVLMEKSSRGPEEMTLDALPDTW